MNIALIGYGKMGHTIERLAPTRGHRITTTIDVDNREAAFASDTFRHADVAIEFTGPQTAYDNILRCLRAGLPVVSGSTGWTARMDELKAHCHELGGAFFYASNFSLGMNLFFAINDRLAELMNAYPNYDVSLTETHHIHKLDAPSGTAITLAEDIIRRVDRKTRWVKGEAEAADELGVRSVRQGEVPGRHEVIYDSTADTIRITHEAKNRDGFALGALLAAEFIRGRKGVFGMKDLMGL
ncbi:4-hydroxy-tetrahydrodipicolinate reductase [Tannerella sp. oral taxon 808]|nr:4-hydroxy-tetrahydrodipicolinate reductase [Tannerella sp. oral taxon 808]